MTKRQRRSSRKRPLIGAQVRKLRTERGLTLAQVSERSGLNVGYLSQVETDKASPSLETLATLAETLEVPIHWLLVDAAPAPRVVRRHERQSEHGSNGGCLEIVDGGLARTVRIVEGDLPPGTRTALMTDAGEEHHLVLEGRVILRQGAFEAELGPGDYLVWDGSFPHEAETLPDAPARLLIITPGPGGVAME
jgi:transcriptional regulator with XRE-family HTH domain